MSELGWLLVVLVFGVGLLFVAEWRERRDRLAREEEARRKLKPSDVAVVPPNMPPPTATLLDFMRAKNHDARLLRVAEILSRPNFPLVMPPTRWQRARWWVANRLRDAARWLEE